MATSVANLDITQYVKVNSQQGSVTLQSLRDTVRVVFSDVKPTRDNSVFHTLGDKDNPLQISDIDSDVWVLSMTDTSSLVITETSSTINVNIESPVPLRTTSDNLDELITDQRRFRVGSSSREEQASARGVYFASSLTRVGRLIDGIPTYTVIDTDDLYTVLEDAVIDIDYQNSGDGNVSLKAEFYAINSNKSDITVTGGTPINLGVPLNMDFVNTLSNASFNFDATVTINSGEPDFIIVLSQYYRDTAGNRESLTGVKGSFLTGIGA